MLNNPCLLCSTVASFRLSVKVRASYNNQRQYLCLVISLIHARSCHNAVYKVEKLANPENFKVIYSNDLARILIEQM